MPTPEPFEPRHTARHSEQGNIALVTALLVMALAGVGIGMARFVQVQAESSAEMRLSNYAGTLAQNVAESAINNLLYNWMNGGALTANTATVTTANVSAWGGTLLAFPPVTTSYTGYSGAVTSNCSYTLTVTVGPGSTWVITSAATVTAAGPLLPSLPWRSVTRTVQATVPNAGPTAIVTGFARL